MVKTHGWILVGLAVLLATPACKEEVKGETEAKSEDDDGAKKKGTSKPADDKAKSGVARTEGKYCADGDGSKCPCKAEGKQDYPGTKNLWICEMDKAVTIQGIPCGPGRTVFEDGGKLTECRLEKDTEVEGYTCKGGMLSTQFFSKSGHLKYCSLGKDATVDGFECRSGPNLVLTGKGKLWECGLKGTKQVGDFSCKSTVQLHKDGSLRRCKLAADAKVGDDTLPADSYVGLHDNGKLRVLYPSKDATVAGQSLAGSKQHCFDKDGKVDAGMGCAMVAAPPED